MALIQFLFFMAFMKFYRRFTLESFMCMVSMESEKEQGDDLEECHHNTIKIDFNG